MLAGQEPHLHNGPLFLGSALLRVELKALVGVEGQEPHEEGCLICPQAMPDEPACQAPPSSWTPPTSSSGSLADTKITTAPW